MFSTEHDFQQRLWAASISMALIPTIYSNHFLDLAGIYSGGNLDWIDWANLPPDMELVEFVDPFSYRLYHAVRYPDADLGMGPGPAFYSTSIAAQMLDHANNLKAEYVYWKAEYDSTPDATNYENMISYQTELQRYIMSLEAVRGLTAEYQLLDVSE